MYGASAALGADEETVESPAHVQNGDVSGEEEEEDACSTDEAVLARFIQLRIESLSETGKLQRDSLHLDDMDFVTSLIDANAAKLLSSSLTTRSVPERSDDEEKPRLKKTSPNQQAASHAFTAKTEGTPTRSKSSRAAVKSSATAADVLTPIRRRGYSNNTIVRKSTTTRPVSAPHRKPSM